MKTFFYNELKWSNMQTKPCSGMARIRAPQTTRSVPGVMDRIHAICLLARTHQGKPRMSLRVLTIRQMARILTHQDTLIGMRGDPWHARKRRVQFLLWYGRMCTSQLENTGGTNQTFSHSMLMKDSPEELAENCCGLLQRWTKCHVPFKWAHSLKYSSYVSFCQWHSTGNTYSRQYCTWRKSPP